MNTKGVPGNIGDALAGTVVLSSITDTENFYSFLFKSKIDQMILHNLHLDPLFYLGQSSKIGRLIEIGEHTENCQSVEIKQYRHYDKCPKMMEELLSDVPGERKIEIVRGMHAARYRLDG